ncbi:MAG: 2OG-Fe(II) oxygenase [Myxococcota bacterium]
MAILESLRRLDRRVHRIADVVTPAQRAAILARLEMLPATALAPVDSPLGAIRQWGCMIGPTPLAPTGPDPRRYDEENNALWSGLGALAAPLQAAVLDALQSLTPSAVQIAPGRQIASARRMPEGDGAPRHIDRYPKTSAYAELREACVLDEQLVWYLMLRGSPDGGALRVYPGAHAPDEVPAEDARFDRYDAPEGTLLIHPAAQVWHAVEPPQGGERITLGGICAPLRDGSGWWTCA